MEHSYRLVVSCNKKYPIIHTPGTVYVEAGRKIRLEKTEQIGSDESEFLDSLPFGDDTGENISLRNPEWNEMTVIYWVFRNYEKLGSPEYIGFEQYRRHFIFDEWRKVPGRALCFQFDEVNQDYEKVLRQGREHVEGFLSKYDLLYPKYQMRCSVYEQYRREAPNGHHIEDLDLIIMIISEFFPSYKAYTEKYLSGRMNCFCNMFVMRRELFFEYCNFIFPVLFEFEKRRSNADRSFAERRLFISERLTGIFICRLLSKEYRCCPVPVALVSHSEKAELVQCTVSCDSDNAAVIEDFGSGAAAVAACVVSIGESLKRGRWDAMPDVMVLSETLSPAERKLLSDTAGSYGLRLRFPEISPENAASGCFKLSRSRGLPGDAHVLQSSGICGLFLLPYLRNYRKIAFIDSRCVITGDLGELFRSSAESGFAAVPASLRFYLASKSASLALGQPHKVLAESADFFSAPLVILNAENALDSGAADWPRKSIGECLKNGSFDESVLKKSKAEFREKFLAQIEVLSCSWDTEPEFISQSMEHKLLTEDTVRLIKDAKCSPRLLDFSQSSVKPWIQAVYEEDLIWWENFRKCPGSDVLLQSVRHGAVRDDSACVKGSTDTGCKSSMGIAGRVSGLISKALSIIRPHS